MNVIKPQVQLMMLFRTIMIPSIDAYALAYIAPPLHSRKTPTSSKCKQRGIVTCGRQISLACIHISNIDDPWSSAYIVDIDDPFRGLSSIMIRNTNVGTLVSHVSFITMGAQYQKLCYVEEMIPRCRRSVLWLCTSGFIWESVNAIWCFRFLIGVSWIFQTTVCFA